MTQGPDYKHWTLGNLRDVHLRVQDLQLQLSAVSTRCTDRRIRKRAFVATHMLSAVMTILSHEPDSQEGREYALSMLNIGLSQYGIRAELVPDPETIKSYVMKRDGHSSP